MKIGSLIRLKPDGNYGPLYTYDSEDVVLVVGRFEDRGYNCISAGKYPEWLVYDDALGLFDLILEGTI